MAGVKAGGAEKIFPLIAAENAAGPRQIITVLRGRILAVDLALCAREASRQKNPAKQRASASSPGPGRDPRGGRAIKIEPPSARNKMVLTSAAAPRYAGYILLFLVNSGIESAPI